MLTNKMGQAEHIYGPYHRCPEEFAMRIASKETNVLARIQYFSLLLL